MNLPQQYKVLILNYTGLSMIVGVLGSLIWSPKVDLFVLIWNGDRGLFLRFRFTDNDRREVSYRDMLFPLFSDDYVGIYLSKDGGTSVSDFYNNQMKQVSHSNAYAGDNLSLTSRLKHLWMKFLHQIGMSCVILEIGLVCILLYNVF